MGPDLEHSQPQQEGGRPQSVGRGQAGQVVVGHEEHSREDLLGGHHRNAIWETGSGPGQNDSSGTGDETGGEERKERDSEERPFAGIDQEFRRKSSGKSGRIRRPGANVIKLFPSVIYEFS